MTGEHQEADFLGVEALHDFPDSEEITQGLGHLLLVHSHETVVHPQIHERLASGAAGLGDLVLVVGKLQVHSTAVNVEMCTQQAHGHGRALDVPAGTTLAPG